MNRRRTLATVLSAWFALTSTFLAQSEPPPADSALAAAIAKLETELVREHGEDQRARVRRGLKQVSDFWRPTDGDAAAFETFVNSNFAGDAQALDALFVRFQTTLEQLDGHLLEIAREFRRQVDLDLGPILPMDQILAGYDPWAHVSDDLFANKVAFIALLNFPVTTLEERLSEGQKWSRREWAAAHLALRFSRRVPADARQALSEALADAEAYIAEYNIWMHHLLDGSGQRLFPPKLRLITHWNLRDELKADYNGPAPLAKQRTIAQVMERIVTQTIPAAVINNPQVDWNPFTNETLPAAVNDSESRTPPPATVSNAPEPDSRYAKLLAVFQANRKVDANSPTNPTLIDRRFNEDRAIPEQRVRAMFDAILTSPVVPRIAKVIAGRLGRPLEPFDIWYSGFQPRGAYPESELDAVVRKRYPTAGAYERAIPDMLQKLGFSKTRAGYVAGNIVVDPSRGAGHALGAQRRGDKAHLRTRVEKDGMNYKGYNIAVHEMGHNAEQTFSLNDIDYYSLSGVPNNAFTEALAFVFQNRDLELLGLGRPDAQNEALKTLNEFWNTYEIAGVSLVDMGVWHWMYEHPDATARQLREATIQISRDVWNQYFAAVFGTRDVVLLGIYSHMISNMLYLPDYTIAHLIAFQIEQHVGRSGNLGAEFERMAKIGNIVPDLWMRTATGSPVGPDALLEAAGKALDALK